MKPAFPWGMAGREYLNEDHPYHHYIQITQSIDPTESQEFVGKCGTHINSLLPGSIHNLSKAHENNTKYEQCKMSSYILTLACDGLQCTSFQMTT